MNNQHHLIIELLGQCPSPFTRPQYLTLLLSAESILILCNYHNLLWQILELTLLNHSIHLITKRSTGQCIIHTTNESQECDWYMMKNLEISFDVILNILKEKILSIPPCLGCKRYLATEPHIALPPDGQISPNSALKQPSQRSKTWQHTIWDTCLSGGEDRIPPRGCWTVLFDFVVLERLETGFSHDYLNDRPTRVVVLLEAVAYCKWSLWDQGRT